MMKTPLFWLFALLCPAWTVAQEAPSCTKTVDHLFQAALSKRAPKGNLEALMDQAKQSDAYKEAMQFCQSHWNESVQNDLLEAESPEQLDALFADQVSEKDVKKAVSDFDQRLFANIQKLLSKEDLKYQVDAERQRIELGFSDEGRSFRYSIRLGGDDRFHQLEVYAFYPQNIDETHRGLVAQYLTYRNFNYRFGSYEMDLRDGEVAFKVSLPLGDRQMPSDDMLLMFLLLPFKMIRDDAEKIEMIVKGELLPAETVD